MPKAVAKGHPDSGRSGGRVRTDGSPRLLRPGEPGHPGGPNIYIRWIEKSAGVSTTKRITTFETDEGLAQAFFTRWKAMRAAPQSALTVNVVLDRYVAHKKADRDRKARQKVDLTHPLGSDKAAREKALTIALAQAETRHRSLISALRPIREHFGALPPRLADPEAGIEGISATYQREYVTKRLAATRRRGDTSKEAETNVAEQNGTVSDRTVSIELAYLRAALNLAADEGEIKKATLPKIKLPRGKAKARRRVLTRAEFKRFMVELFSERTPIHLRIAILLGMLTSQRSKAVKALTWASVDYEEGVIRFTDTDPDGADNKRIQDTPLTPDMAQWLAEVQEAAVSDYVIEWEGEPVGSYKSAWRRLLGRAGLQDVRIHDLRRVAATVALNAGGDPKRIALLLADTEATTLRNYAHASPDLLLGVVRLIEGEVSAARTAEVIEGPD